MHYILSDSTNSPRGQVFHAAAPTTSSSDRFSFALSKSDASSLLPNPCKIYEKIVEDSTKLTTSR